MKQTKRFLACLLAVVVVLGLLPPATAASDISILKTIGYTGTDTVSPGSSRSIKLTVDYSFEGPLDLTSVFYSCDESTYTNIVLTPSADTLAVGSSATLTVTFYKISDTSTQYTTTYTISLVQDSAEAATFSGTISESVEMGGNALTLDSEDFTDCYTQNDGSSMGSIKIKGSNTTVGKLYYNGSAYSFSDEISVSNLTSGLLTFKPSSSACGTVSYTVTAYDSGGTSVGTATLTITVYSVPEVESSISKTVYTGSTVSFTASTFTDCLELYGTSLVSITITPTTSDYGTFYYGTSAISASSSQTITAANISKLTYEASSAGSDTFTWTAANSAGSSDEGSGTIAVSSASLSVTAYTASTTVAKGDTWTVKSSHFSYTPSSATINYIKITSIPTSTDGYLYLTTALAASSTYGYSAISANTALATNAVIPASYIQYLRLATKSTSTSASVSFSWTATTSTSVTSATWATAATYKVKFDSAGSLDYTTYTNIPISFSGTDFSDEYEDATSDTLSYVLFTLPTSTYGKLYYNYDFTTSKGTAVSASTKFYLGSTPSLSSVVFIPYTDYSGTVTISYKAYNADGGYVYGEITVTVSSSAGGTVFYAVEEEEPLQLDAADFLESFATATGETLDYVKFTLPDSDYGELYYNYTSDSSYDSTVSASKKYYVYSEPYLSYVTFVPTEEYSGRVIISYTAYDEDGDSYKGKLGIMVENTTPAGILSYSCKTNGTVQLSGDDFSDAFISRVGSVLSYVKFTTPKSTYGVLYLDYDSSTAKGTSVTSSIKYYDGSTPGLSDITFVAAKDYVGDLDITYTVYTASGDAYIGKLTITIGEGSTGAISYTTEQNTKLTFSASNFVKNFNSSTDGKSLSYVTFTLPSTTYGKLYYDYNSSSDYDSLVKAATKYYASSTPAISKVTFVPTKNYVGSFTIAYTGYTSDGDGYSGKIKITVGSSDELTITYTIDADSDVTFSASDFKSALSSSAGATLSYVKFDQPSSTEGTLYYKYSSSSNSNTEVSESKKYYYSGSSSNLYLSKVTFVSEPDYAGTVTIDFEAYDTDGENYDGTVNIVVGSTDAGTVEYETSENTPVTLDADQFSSTLDDVSGVSLSYVKFTLPSSSYGKLYYGYTSPTSYGGLVAASTKYYESASPSISDITFVPAQGYTGDVVIEYTAVSSAGNAYSGELVIYVLESAASGSFSDIDGYAWASDAITYLYENGIVKGTGSGLFSPGNSISRGDFVLMLYRAFNLSGSTTSNFSDVPTGSYYYSAIATAKSLGLVEGSGGKFDPTSSITRQDAMVILYRTLESEGVSLTTGSASDISKFSDASSVSDYAKEAMETLVKSGVINGSGGKLNPSSMISRAEMAVVLYRALQI